MAKTHTHRKGKLIMNIFTQLVYVVGKLTPTGVQMLGTGFLVSKEGHIVTSHHVTGSENSNLVVLAPHISDINSYQDIDNNQCTPLSTTITDIDPIHDLAILKARYVIQRRIAKNW